MVVPVDPYFCQSVPEAASLSVSAERSRQQQNNNYVSIFLQRSVLKFCLSKQKGCFHIRLPLAKPCELVWWYVEPTTKYLSHYLTNLMHKILFHIKFYFMPLHVSSTCAHHQEVKIALHSLWYHHTYRWPSSAMHNTVRYQLPP